MCINIERRTADVSMRGLARLLDIRYVLMRDYIITNPKYNSYDRITWDVVIDTLTHFGVRQSPPNYNAKKLLIAIAKEEAKDMLRKPYGKDA